MHWKKQEEGERLGMKKKGKQEWMDTGRDRRWEKGEKDGEGERMEGGGQTEEEMNEMSLGIIS